MLRLRPQAAPALRPYRRPKSTVKAQSAQYPALQSARTRRAEFQRDKFLGAILECFGHLRADQQAHAPHLFEEAIARAHLPQAFGKACVFSFNVRKQGW